MEPHKTIQSKQPETVHSFWVFPQGKVLVLTLCLWLASSGNGQSADTMAGAGAATLGHERDTVAEDKELGFLMVATLPYWPHMLTQTVNQKKTCRHHYFRIPLQ